MSKHLLVTNDDGVGSHFLQELVAALRLHGFRITLVAPKNEQSWISRALSRHREVAVEQSSHPEYPVWIVDGTPTDCVNIGLGHLVKEPVDAVVSGINLGVNVTLPLTLSSGTVAGALEGMLWGLPAFAFSQRIEKDDFERIRIAQGKVEGAALDSLRAASNLAAIQVSEGLEDGLPEGSVRSINFPAETTCETPLRRARLAQLRLGSLFSEKSPGRFVFRFQDGRAETPSPDSDASLLEGGFATMVDIPYLSLCAAKKD